MLGLNKLKEKAESVKTKLESVVVIGKSAYDEVTVECSGRMQILKIDINDSILKVRSKEDIDRMVKDAVNDALRQAEQIASSELKQVMPNIPGMDGLFR